MRGHLILTALDDRWPATVDQATDSNRDPATDPAPGWGGRAWEATDRISTLTDAMGLGAALEALCAGKSADGLSRRSITWYRMIGERLIGRFGARASALSVHVKCFSIWPRPFPRGKSTKVPSAHPRSAAPIRTAKASCDRKSPP